MPPVRLLRSSVALPAAVVAAVIAGAPAAVAPAAVAASADRALRPAAAPEAAAAAKRCKRGQTRVRAGGSARCLRTRQLFRGLPRSADALAGRLVRSSRALETKARGKRSIAALLGPDAAAVARWEDDVVKVGRAELARRLRSAGIAQAGPVAGAAQEESLGLPTLKDLGDWVQEAVSWVTGDKPTATGSGRGKALVKASLTTAQRSYQFELDESRPSGIYCPKEDGKVQAFGSLKARREVTRDGETVKEGFNANYEVTGTVSRDAQLVSYDIVIDWSGATGTARGIKPAAAGVAIVDARSIDISWQGGRSREVEFGMAEAMRYAQEQALRFLDNAEDAWNRQKSCVKVTSTPAQVKRGASATVTIRTTSRITGKPVDADLDLKPSGGATASPAKTTTKPGKPAKVKVTMPKGAKGTRARAAANPRVDLTALSRQGRATGSIGSGGLPEAYEVKLSLNGAARFATHAATGTMDATWKAAREAGAAAVRWSGGTTAAWTNLGVTSKTDCSYGDPVGGSGPLSVQITADEAGERLTVTFGHGGGGTGFAFVLQVSYTVTCPGDPPAVIPGQPGVSLVALEPLTFTLPATGGSQALASSPQVQDGGDGFFTTGTLTLTPL